MAITSQGLSQARVIYQINTIDINYGLNSVAKSNDIIN